MSSPIPSRHRTLAGSLIENLKKQIAEEVITDYRENYPRLSYPTCSKIVFHNSNEEKKHA